MRGRQKSIRIDILEYRKLNPKTEKVVKTRKGIFDIYNRLKSPHFAGSMTRGETFYKKANCNQGHSSIMLIKARCDLNS